MGKITTYAKPNLILGDGCGFVCSGESVGCFNRFVNPVVGLCPVFLWCFAFV